MDKRIKYRIKEEITRQSVEVLDPKGGKSKFKESATSDYWPQYFEENTGFSLTSWITPGIKGKWQPLSFEPCKTLREAEDIITKNKKYYRSNPEIVYHDTGESGYPLNYNMPNL